MSSFYLMVTVLTALMVLDVQMPAVSPIETLLVGEEGESSSISWPLVEGTSGGIERINEILEYKNVTGESIDEIVTNYRMYGAGIVGSSFVVNWMNAEYLDLQITVETLGAYPSQMVFNFLFNLETGEEVTAEDLFMEEQITDLVKLCDHELQNRITDQIEDEFTFTETDLNQLGMRRSGIVFHYDFNFPHASAAMEPDGELFFSWNVLNEFLLPEARH